MAKDYQEEIDFAFFVVNFHYTKSDYESLTPKEKVFIYKAWENKVVSDTTHISNAVNNAIGNALQKKGRKPTPLWQKKRAKLDKDYARDSMKTVDEVERRDGKSWVEKIYKANGLKGPRKEWSEGQNKH